MSATADSVSSATHSHAILQKSLAQKRYFFQFCLYCCARTCSKVSTGEQLTQGITQKFSPIRSACRHTIGIPLANIENLPVPDNTTNFPKRVQQIYSIKQYSPWIWFLKQYITIDFATKFEPLKLTLICARASSNLHCHSRELNQTLCQRRSSFTAVFWWRSRRLRNSPSNSTWLSLCKRSLSFSTADITFDWDSISLWRTWRKIVENMMPTKR